MITASQSVRSLLKIWQDLRGQKTLPLREQIIPNTFPIWGGQLSFNEVHDDKIGPRIFVANEGAAVGRAVHESFDHRYLDDCVPVAAKDAALRPYLQSITALQPVFSQIAPNRESVETKRFLRFVMPLADLNPDRVAFFLVWLNVRGADPDASGSVYDQWLDRSGSLFDQSTIIGNGDEIPIAA